MITEDVVRVHVDNAEDLRVIRTEAKEPEHFAFETFVVANASGYDKVRQILNLDPQRKDWSIIAQDAPIVLCHSYAQANSPRNQDTNVPFPDGAYIASGGSFTFTGTGPAWIVATSATPCRVSVAVNRRGSA